MTLHQSKTKYGFGICLILSLLLSEQGAAQIYAGGVGDGFSINSFAQADNPLLNIYSGGANDGFSINCFAQADNVLFNIYKGGNQDGFTVGCFAQADNILFDIYKGGSQDGFTIGCFAQASNVLYDIYKGGIQDGFTLSCFAQADNPLYDIYKGGSNDGFSLNCFAQANNVLYDIYKGGSGDGLSKFCLGTLSEVPLPVELLNFEGRYENQSVILQWTTASEVENDYFVLERSATAENFIPIYRVNGAGTTTQQRNYSYTDESPAQGMNYYRLKQTDYDLQVTYSHVISVFAESGGAPAIYIYPNPSDNTTTVQVLLKGVGQGLPAELVITDISGQIISSFSAIPDSDGRIKLPNTGLASGVYLVTVSLPSGKFTGKWVIK